MTSSPFTDAELAYLLTQRLGRLATVDAAGRPQNSPVGFKINKILGTVDIRGYDLGATRKFRNVEGNPDVSFVVDDIASLDPWSVRGIEIRGAAEALRNVPHTGRGLSAEIIRIHPRRVVSWGVDASEPDLRRRTVAAS